MLSPRLSAGTRDSDSFDSPSSLHMPDIANEKSSLNARTINPRWARDDAGIWSPASGRAAVRSPCKRAIASRRMLHMQSDSAPGYNSDSAHGAIARRPLFATLGPRRDSGSDTSAAGGHIVAIRRYVDLVLRVRNDRLLRSCIRALRMHALAATQKDWKHGGAPSPRVCVVPKERLLWQQREEELEEVVTLLRQRIVRAATTHVARAGTLRSRSVLWCCWQALRMHARSCVAVREAQVATQQAAAARAAQLRARVTRLRHAVTARAERTGNRELLRFAFGGWRVFHRLFRLETHAGVSATRRRFRDSEGAAQCLAVMFVVAMSVHRFTPARSDSSSTRRCKPVLPLLFLPSSSVLDEYAHGAGSHTNLILVRKSA
eukprot:6189266-Pleurochrysis_carterae.AAC.2